MSLPSRLLGANPSIQVSTLLSGTLTTPSAKGVFSVGDYVQIATASPSSTTTVTFDNISQNFKNLQLRWSVKSSASGLPTMGGRFNNNSTADNYTYARLEGDYGSGTNSLGTSSGTAANLFMLAFASASHNAANFGCGYMDIPNYNLSGVKKNTFAFFGILDGSSATQRDHFMAHTWGTTDAITRIDLIDTGGGSFVAGSVISLYGMSA